MDGNGIDKDGIRKQVTSIEFYIAELKTELDNITNKINSLKTCYVGQGANSIINRYNDNSSRFTTMFTKLNNLKNELEETITKYELQDKKIASEIGISESN